MFKYVTDEDHTIKIHIKETIAVKQRKPSQSRDKGLDLPAIYSPLSEYVMTK